jgi:hypothetical protein
LELNGSLRSAQRRGLCRTRLQSSSLDAKRTLHNLEPTIISSQTREKLPSLENRYNAHASADARTGPPPPTARACPRQVQTTS